jgi:hypothetical protein
MKDSKFRNRHSRKEQKMMGMFLFCNKKVITCVQKKQNKYAQPLAHLSN